MDGVQNAANNSLSGGGGSTLTDMIHERNRYSNLSFPVDGALHKAAGKDLMRECRWIATCNTGQTEISRGYNLPAKYVLHTVGPVGAHPDLLRSCYRTTLDTAVKYGLKSVVSAEAIDVRTVMTYMGQFPCRPCVGSQQERLDIL